MELHCYYLLNNLHYRDTVTLLGDETKCAQCLSIKQQNVTVFLYFPFRINKLKDWQKPLKQQVILTTILITANFYFWKLVISIQNGAL